MKKFVEFEKAEKIVRIFLSDGIDAKFYILIENVKSQVYPSMTKSGWAWRCDSPAIKEIFSANNSNNLFLLHESAEKANKIITRQGYEKAFVEGYRGEF